MQIRYKVLAYLFSLSVIVYLDRVCISLVSGQIKRDLSISTEMWGWVLSAFALSYAIFELPTGIMGDRVGPRRILVRVVVWWSIFTALTGMAFHWIHLVVVRFLFGAGEAGAYPNTSIVVARWFPASETGMAQSYIWAAGRIGGALAPILVLSIAQAYHWRAAFWVLGVLGLVWAVFWWYWFRDFPHEKPSVSGQELAKIESERQYNADGHHLDWRQVLRSRNVWALMLMFHFYMWGAYFFTGWLSTYLEEGRHFTVEQRKIFVTLPFFLGAIGCFVSGYASDWLSKRYGLKFGRRSLGMAGMGLSSIVILCAAMTTNNEHAAILLSIGMGFKDLTLPVAFAVCVDIGQHKSGTVSGAMNMFGQLGAVFLGVVFGYIVKMNGGDFNAPLYLISGLLFLGSLLWLVIDPTEKVR